MEISNIPRNLLSRKYKTEDDAYKEIFDHYITNHILKKSDVPAELMGDVVVKLSTHPLWFEFDVYNFGDDDLIVAKFPLSIGLHLTDAPAKKSDIVDADEFRHFPINEKTVELLTGTVRGVMQVHWPEPMRKEIIPELKTRYYTAVAESLNHFHGKKKELAEAQSAILMAEYIFYENPSKAVPYLTKFKAIPEKLTVCLEGKYQETGASGDQGKPKGKGRIRKSTLFFLEMKKRYGP